MWYRKNLPLWERVVRVAAAAAIIACGLVGLSSLAVGYLVAAAGAALGLTGFAGYCPACAVAGRRLAAPKS